MSETWKPISEPSRNNKFAVVEIYNGEFHAGFPTLGDAKDYIAHRQNEHYLEDSYAYRAVQILYEVDSDD